MSAVLERNPAKTKRCKACKDTFIPARPMQHVCSTGCAVAVVTAKREKERERKELEERRETRAKLRKLDGRKYWLPKAREAAQEYARVRDHADGCISCDKGPHWTGGVWHGSHFRSVAAASAVQLNLWNIHKACNQCNTMKGGNIHGYTPRIVEKVGQEKVDWLKSQNQLAAFTVEYLERYCRVIRKRTRRMKKRIGLQY